MDGSTPMDRRTELGRGGGGVRKGRIDGWVSGKIDLLFFWIKALYADHYTTA